MTSLDFFAEQSALPDPALFVPPSDLETAIARERLSPTQINSIGASELGQRERQQIRNLVKSSLNEKLKANYFEQIAEKGATVYYAGNFEAIGIAYVTPFGAYLDILATKPKLQGGGRGSALFDKIAAEMGPGLFLRSQPFREFDYNKRTGHVELFRNCDGIEYNGYFKGMPADKVTGARQWMAGKPSNYEPKQTILQNK